MNSKHQVAYESDASRLIGKAGKVVFPKNVEEIKLAVSTANSDVVPRGAGTNLVGGCVPNDSVVIDLSKMNKVSNFDIKQKTVRVEAGTTIKELNEKLNAVGLEFPIVPLNSAATIGGMIAMNSSGESTLKYGTMKDWIEGIEFVNGRGEEVKTLRSDISDICGMEGTTGIIVAATLKIIVKSLKSASIFQADNLEEIFSIARRLKLENEVIMLQLLPPFISKLLKLPEKYNLIIEFISDRGKIRGVEYDNLFKMRSKIYHSLFSEGYYNFEDPKLFFDKLKEFISFLELNHIPYFSYLGAGIVHPCFKDSEEHKRKAVVDFIKKSKAKPSKFGIGLARKTYLEDSETKVIERIKQRYDPFGKFNKGKLIDMDFHEKRLGNLEKSRKVVEPERIKEVESSMVPRKLESPKVDELDKVSDEGEGKTVGMILKEMEQREAHVESKDSFEKPVVEVRSSSKIEDSLPKPQTSSEYKMIQDIMTGKNKPAPAIEKVGEIIVRDNLERAPLDDLAQDVKKESGLDDIRKDEEEGFSQPSSLPQSLKPKEDPDLIDSIMTNKFKKDEADKKE